MKTIYVEEAVYDHPRVQKILSRFKNCKNVIKCQHYGEVFNPKSQNFRLQKKQPAMILAEKRGKLVLPTPEGFGIGGKQNYYFSHMLNCLYDCRYCFLQGMFRSANYVYFVNFEDMMQDIELLAQQSPDEPTYFFSGYDCDSLAFDPITGFLPEFLPFFQKLPNAILELRTKSTNIKSLLAHEAFNNCVAAFSFTPDEISRAVEHGVPLVAKRIDAMRQLAERGWQLGLRFDPLIYASNFESLYTELINTIFSKLPENSIHSVSVGPMRFPAKMYQQLVKFYPKDKLLAHPLHKRDNYFSYKAEVEQKMKAHILKELRQFVPETLVFQCSPL